MPRPIILVLLLTLLSPAACRREPVPEYHLTGQILAVDPRGQTLTIKHGDIEGLMPGMTMMFAVDRKELMEGRTPGELVRATLILRDTVAVLTSIESTGHAPIAELPAAPPMHVLAAGEAVPDLKFVDERGQPRQFSEWRGKAVAVTFAYTRCPLPDFCPAIDKRFAETQAALDIDPALAAVTHLLTVTVDPAYDTPSVLEPHARALGARPDRWTFATGDPAELAAFASRFGVAIMRDDPAAREVVHNLRTGIVDPRGAFSAALSGSDWTADDLVAELRRAALGR